MKRFKFKQTKIENGKLENEEKNGFSRFIVQWKIHSGTEVYVSGLKK